MTTVGAAEDAARTDHESGPVEALARLGLASRGLVWLVLSALAFSLVLGRQAQADQEGALRALAAWFAVVMVATVWVIVRRRFWRRDRQDQAP